MSMVPVFFCPEKNRERAAALEDENSAGKFFRRSSSAPVNHFIYGNRLKMFGPSKFKIIVVCFALSILLGVILWSRSDLPPYGDPGNELSKIGRAHV